MNIYKCSEVPPEPGGYYLCFGTMGHGPKRKPDWHKARLLSGSANNGQVWVVAGSKHMVYGVSHYGYLPCAPVDVEATATT